MRDLSATSEPLRRLWPQKYRGIGVLRMYEEWRMKKIEAARRAKEGVSEILERKVDLGIFSMLLFKFHDTELFSSLFAELKSPSVLY